MRGRPEGAFKGAGEVRVAALNKRAEIGDEYPARDMTINVVAHHAHLPGQHAPPVIGNYSHGWRFDLLSQQ